MAEKKLTAREAAALAEAAKYFGDPKLGQQRITQFYKDMENRGQRKVANTGPPTRSRVPMSTTPTRPTRGAGNTGNKNAVRPGPYQSPTAKKTDMTAEIARGLGFYGTVAVGAYGVLTTNNPITRAIDNARANKGLPPRITPKPIAKTPSPAPRATPKPAAKSPSVRTLTPRPSDSAPRTPKATIPKATTPKATTLRASGSAPRTPPKPSAGAAKLNAATKAANATRTSGTRSGSGKTTASRAGAGAGRTGVRQDPSDLIK